MIELVEKLSNSYGAPGFEDDVIEVIKKEYSHRFDIEEDKMRNLVIKRKEHSGNKPVVMLDGHSDEVAFMIKSINPNGTMKFVPLGSWVPESVASTKVKVLNAEGVWLTGIVSSIAPHFRSGEKKFQDIGEMTIDLGATNFEDLRNNYKVEVGAPAVPATRFEYNKHSGIMFGKAFDNRLGCGCVLETLMALEGMELEVDVVGSIASQEEVGTRGVRVNAYRIQADIGIVFEGSPADDTFRGTYDAQGVLKKGTQIRHRDNSMITSPRLIKYAKNVAEDSGVKYQSAVRISGGTDGGQIHVSGLAIPCIVLGVPVRYAHTACNFSSIEDYKATIDLAVGMIEKVNNDIIQSL